MSRYTLKYTVPLAQEVAVIYPFSPLSTRKNGDDFPLLEAPPPTPPGKNDYMIFRYQNPPPPTPPQKDGYDFPLLEFPRGKMGIPDVGKTSIKLISRHTKLSIFI